MKCVVDLAYVVVAVAISPMVLYRMMRHNRYRTGWSQRFGKIARCRPASRCIWIHAVSVGEVNASKTIIKQLADRLPDFEIVISTTTDTGFARAKALFGDSHSVFYFPFDFSPVMRRAFANIQPAICLLMELEVWPNFVQIADERKVPVVIVNGRITERSFSRYKIISPLAKSIFEKITLILAQTDEYARRFKQLGCPAEKVVVTGSLKYDTAQIADKVDGADLLKSQLNLRNDTLWVAGGTGDDEEAIIVDVYKELKSSGKFENLRLAIVPRKPERFEQVAQLIEQNGFPVARYSRIKELFSQNKSTAANDQSSIDSVILGDTMGDLRKFYSLANIIFVGRSLVPMGGSDMMEAAALGKCTLFGPHAFNFRQTVDDLLANEGAIVVKDKQDLSAALRKCLSEPEFAAQIAAHGQDVIRKNQGATNRSVEAILCLLKSKIKCQ
jgi:3-deoxy-D-manno-octulosonic-acid transferase